mgnify:CR=1 FL=1
MTDNAEKETKEERRKRLLEKAGAPLPDHSELAGEIRGVVLAPSDGPQTLPPVGSLVRATVNGIGTCEVLGYFTSEGFLGVVGLPMDPPRWYLAQKGEECPCHLFGCEYALDLEV